MTTNYPITETGSIDMLGDEFPNPFQAKALPPITDADIVAHCTQGPMRPRPGVTAWKGADVHPDAYYIENGVWLHCQTDEPWAGEPVNLLDAVDQFRASQNAIIDQISTALFASLDTAPREGSDYQMEAAQ
jgi:hypothetical protein